VPVPFFNGLLAAAATRRIKTVESTKIIIDRHAPIEFARVGKSRAVVLRRADAAARPSPLSPLLFPLLLLLLAGCSRDISSTYGERQGFGADSVNGTAVLGEMFEKAGHRVFSWRALSPRLWERADCVVWFPDDFEPPRAKKREWLENWLKHRPGLTLIYVGRDFDAAPWYWRHILPDAPKQQEQLVRERLAESQHQCSDDRRRLPKFDNCEWFTVDGAPELRQAERPNDLAKKIGVELPLDVRQAKPLEGAAAWLEGIDAAKTDIELRSRLSPPDDAEVLLRSGDDVLVSRQEVGDSQLIVVANGSFLLNLPLVNHEHRKLAGKLIDEIGPPGKTVVFLESRGRQPSRHGSRPSRANKRSSGGRGGYRVYDDGKQANDDDDGEPPIRDDDPSAADPTGLEIFSVWPTNWILLHLAAVGVIFCFSRWPIFGRPKPPATPSPSDFGRHVDALAELLKRTRDRAYAMERILNYRQRVERDK
jgi:hypothetical protein